MTPYMTNFVIIPDMIWLKALSYNEQIGKDKQFLNVWCGTFHYNH